MLEAALAAGISAAGGDALLGGVLPTPAAAILVAALGFDLAAVVSASHNPYRDNGIKFFSADGTKLPDERSARSRRDIEALDRRMRGARRARRGTGPGARAERRRGGLPARAARRFPSSTSRARGDARLRQRRHLPGRAGDLRAARREGRDDRRRPRRAQHQRRAAARPTSSALASGSRRRAAIGFAFDGDGDRVLAVDGDGASTTATS